MLNFERIEDVNHPYFEEAFSLYEASFPFFERRAREDQVRALSDKEYSFNIIKNPEGEMLGILLYWDNADFFYIEHLAVNLEKRGQNIGTRTLSHLKSVVNKPIILEIDPPNDDISIKRKSFYLRGGFTYTDKMYTHYSYRKTAQAHDLHIMSYPAISGALFNTFKQYINSNIMKYSEFNR